MNGTSSNVNGAATGAIKSVAFEPRGQLTVLVALLSCGFFWPSEGAIEGDGLHLAFLWIFALAGALLWNFWQALGDQIPPSIGRPPPGSSRLLSPDRLVTIGLTVFLAGVWLSTWNVFRVSGDRRAALNLAFGWTAIAACGGLCRMLGTRLGCRRAIVNLVAGLSLSLAVYGIWQSHVYYEIEAKAYLKQRQVLETGTSWSEVMRVRSELLSNGVPLEGPGRKPFENRLLHSSEPFGPFALANTLAGVLVVGLVLLSGGLVSEMRSGTRRWIRLVIPILAVGIVSWCLILTKSRSAWVGAAVGVATLLLAVPSRPEQASRYLFRSIARLVLIIGVPAVLLFGAGILSGVIDRQVLLESLRSLQFRFFYWTGAAGVIAEEPLFGAGPGNFRQVYLPHKPVESSESILDPHNFLLDAWCFAGVAGILGMVLFVAGITRSIWSDNDTDAAAVRPTSTPVIRGIVGCLILHFGWLWLSGIALRAQDVATAATIVLAGMGYAAIGRLNWNPLAPAAACVALLVHLLGAGGLQITSLWFLLVALATVAAPPAQRAGGSGPFLLARMLPLLGAIIWAAAAFATLFWGLMPFVSSSLQQSVGHQRIRKGDHRGALHAFELAAAADPLSPTVRQHIVWATTYPLMQRNPQETTPAKRIIAAKVVQAIESACTSHIRSDSRGIGGRLMRARIYDKLHRLTGESEYIDCCVQDLRQVVAWNPTNAAFQVELAIFEEAAGQMATAVKTARKAKEIDAVNQAWRHSDQYLSTDDLETMDRIINGGRK